MKETILTINKEIHRNVLKLLFCKNSLYVDMYWHEHFLVISLLQKQADIDAKRKIWTCTKLQKFKQIKVEKSNTWKTYKHNRQTGTDVHKDARFENGVVLFR